MSPTTRLLESRERLETRLAEGIRDALPPDALDPIIDGLSAVTHALWRARAHGAIEAGGDGVDEGERAPSVDAIMI